MDLQADSIQGVLFPMPGQHQDDALKLWGQLFPGDGPDGFQKAANSPALNSSASGERNGLQTIVNAQVGRVDVVFNQPAAAAAAAAGPPRIADVPAAVRQMGEHLKKFASAIPAIRAAIVIDLAKTVARGSESQEMLAHLPGFAFPPNVSDVTLQFNSRRKFRCVEDADMNRLVAWSSGQVGFVLAAQMQAPNMVMMSPYIGIKIDVNSAPEFRLPSKDIGNIIDELVEESLSIREEGVKRFGE